MGDDLKESIKDVLDADLQVITHCLDQGKGSCKDQAQGSGSE